MEIEHSTNADCESRLTATGHGPVEDERHVRPPLVLLDPLHDRVASDLLLTVEAEAHVDRELAGASKLPYRLDEHEEVPFVVCYPSCVETAVPVRQLERRGLPELERIGRLDVEVRVAEDRRRRLRALGRRHLADDERPPSIPGNYVCRSAGAANAIGDPRSRPLDVAGVGRIGADRRDGDQLGELCAKFLV